METESRIPAAMTWEEIKANHRDDIKRQAILFFKGQGFLYGEPRKKRWQIAVQIVVETWMALGPQMDNVPSCTYCLPDRHQSTPR